MRTSTSNSTKYSILSLVVLTLLLLGALMYMYLMQNTTNDAHEVSVEINTEDSSDVTSPSAEPAALTPAEVTERLESVQAATSSMSSELVDRLEEGFETTSRTEEEVSMIMNRLESSVSE